jgi:hypothetical protein
MPEPSSAHAAAGRHGSGAPDDGSVPAPLGRAELRAIPAKRPR